MRKQSDFREPIEVEFGGRNFSATYTVSSGMVHVVSAYGRKSLVSAGGLPHALAEEAFKELLREADPNKVFGKTLLK